MKNLGRRHFGCGFESALRTSNLLWVLGECRKPTDPLNLTQPNPTCWVESVFKAWWVGMGYKKNFYSGSGWVLVIKLQTRQTRPNPPTHPYLIYI